MAQTKITNNKFEKPLEKHKGDNETVSRHLSLSCHLHSFFSFPPSHYPQFYFHQSRPFMYICMAERGKNYGSRVAVAKESQSKREGRISKQTRVICLLQFYEPKSFCLFMMFLLATIDEKGQQYWLYSTRQLMRIYSKSNH